MSKLNSIKLISLFMITTLCSCGPTINYTRKNSLNIKKTENCEIYVYNTNQSIPFPNINLGEIKFGDTGLSTDCGFETIINIAKKKACEEGADAIQLVEIKTPDGWSTCYRIKARFVKFSYDNNILSTEVLISEPQKEQLIEKYFKNRNMDIIEGIWVSQDTRYEIAIIKNNFNRFPQYDYVAIITNTGLADWKGGETKFLLKKTASDYVFTILYFMQNKSQYGTTITLPNENMIEIPISSNESSVFIRTYPRKASPSSPSRKAEEVSASGTGFSISKDGLIVTAHHVVKNASAIKIHMNNGSIVKANIYKSDPSNDIAILKTDLQTTNYLPIAPLRTVKTGERVFTIGFPISSVRKIKRLPEERINQLLAKSLKHGNVSIEYEEEDWEIKDRGDYFDEMIRLYQQQLVFINDLMNKNPDLLEPAKNLEHIYDFTDFRVPLKIDQKTGTHHRGQLI
jgi:hypothetical protein